MVFADRVDAGAQLAARLEPFRGRDAVVLGLPRGGVPVAAEVAEALDVPLDVIVVRKLGVPFQPELAMGAIGEDGVRVVDTAVVWRGRDHRDRARRRRAPGAGRARRAGWRSCGAGTPPRSTCTAGRRSSSTTASRPGRPLGPPARWPAARRRAGSCSPCRSAPPGRSRLSRTDGRRGGLPVDAASRSDAVGAVVRGTSRQTSDEEVVAACSSRPRPGARRAVGAARSRPADARRGHPGTAAVVARAGTSPCPPAPRGVVVFAHGSGSSRHSPRNRYVAEVLQRGRAGHAAVRPAHPDEEGDRGERLRHRAARRAAGRGDRLAGAPSRGTRPADRLLRREHRRRRGAVGRRRAGRRTSPPWSPAAAGPTSPARGSATVRAPTLLIVGGARRRRARAQPRGAGPSCGVRHRARRRPGRHPPVRGAGHARRGCQPRAELVRPAPAEPSGIRPQWS